jgi:UDPglucose 6-dehydrogenase
MAKSRPICVIGTGYVGMACMVGIAELGRSVHGFDIATDRIRRLRAGIAPYREAGIEEAIRKHIDAGKMHFFEDLREAAIASDIVIVAVGTPAREDGSADLSAVFAVVEQLADVFAEGAWPTIVVRSTVPPGTCDALADIVDGWGELIFAPEFLREGAAVHDFLNPDRIVVGSSTVAAAVPYVQIFESLQKPVVFTSRCNAELIKCCSNAFLALKISFANEIATLCDMVGGTSDDVLRGIGYDRRIGSEFLKPGIGFGGPCFEKDVKSINHAATKVGTELELFSATLRVNDAQWRRIVSMVIEEVGDVDGLTIGVWGLSFKAGTDDIRDSLAIRILDELASRGAVFLAYDPSVHVAPLPPGSRMVSSALEAASADVLLVLTEWPEFARIDPAELVGRITRGTIVDGRNVLDAERAVAAGLTYRGVGRRPNSVSSRPAIATAL